MCWLLEQASTVIGSSEELIVIVGELGHHGCAHPQIQPELVERHELVIAVPRVDCTRHRRTKVDAVR